MSKQGEISDKELLDWLESDYGAGLISDDAGRWVVSEAGMQNMPDPDKATNISTSFFIEAEDWRSSIREAIKTAMEKENGN